MKITHVQRDLYGRSAVSGIHDAVIRMFGFDASSCFRLHLLGQAKEDRRLLLQGVARFGFNEFISDAIVSDVFCWEISSADQNGISIEAWKVVLGGNYVETDLLTIVRKLTDQYQGFLFVFVECSYGGSIAFVCKEFLLESTEERSIS